MDQMLLFPARNLSVGDLNRYARLALEGDPVLQDVWVTGEVSGGSRPSSGHFYFSLKDASAAVRCVMWRDSAARALLPQDGDAVEVHGRVSLYETGGQYQLYVDWIRPAGQGELYADFLRLKTQLEAEGLFDPARKQPLPARPRRIVVVTSPAGAAWRDVQNVLSRRYPLMEVLLAPATVQGDSAPGEICRALRAADRAGADVILLVRGGGSNEDLQAFNDERVVRAIAATRTPVVSGVGHETDFTLADFAADVRAPTPSVAAELVSPDREEALLQLRRMQRRLADQFGGRIREQRASLRALDARIRASSPRARLQNIRQQVDELSRRLAGTLQADLTLRRTRLEGATRMLAGVGPRNVLARGYALVQSEQDLWIVRSPAQAPAGTRLTIQLANGRIKAQSEGAEKPGAGKTPQLPD
jgi:exodeoxyribonuclease VII large subunit